MPYLTIRYGPYKCHGIINHRFQKINGLFGALDQLGYDIEVIPVNDFNRLSIEMFEREVFRCDIRNLMFNMPAEDDPVCQRALRAVDEANRRMSSEDNVPKYTATANSPNVKDNLPSQTDLLIEIKQEDRKAHDIAPEEKISKVKIMENKNTTFGLEINSDQGTIDEDY